MSKNNTTIIDHDYILDIFSKKEFPMKQDIFLMNFRIPVHLKSKFEETCQQLRTNMTAEMNRMIRDFIKRSQDDL